MAWSYDLKLSLGRLSVSTTLSIYKIKSLRCEWQFGTDKKFQNLQYFALKVHLYMPKLPIGDTPLLIVKHTIIIYS